MREVKLSMDIFFIEAVRIWDDAYPMKSNPDFLLFSSLSQKQFEIY